MTTSAKQMQTIQDAFDSLFTRIDELRDDIEQVQNYANKQTEVINDNAKQFLIFRQKLDAATQIIFADDPEFERRVRESVEIYRRINAGNP
jgi:peptidoglycan hydrolase CwlO-like protein